MIIRILYKNKKIELFFYCYVYSNNKPNNQLTDNNQTNNN